MNKYTTFIIRRAFWKRAVTRGDVIKAFGIGTNVATLEINRALRDFGTLLVRQGTGRGSVVVPLIGATIPTEASAPVMLRLFEHLAHASETGLFEDEVAVLAPRNNLTYRSSQDTLFPIMRALIEPQVIEIHYVGLRKGESARWRRVIPRAMEFNGKQWRLLAHDVDTLKTYPLKTFVLPRILDARFLGVMDSVIPRGVTLASVNAQPMSYMVTFHDQMTPDQEEATRRELGIALDGEALLNPRDVYEFRKEHMDDRSGLDTIAWPRIHALSRTKVS